MKIAVTGGIGSGKSYVCRHLTERGIRVYDCDAAAKRLMCTSATLQEKLKTLIGAAVYHDGQLVKPIMAAFLLASDENQKAVNAIVHPAVADDFKASGYDWMECAILFESGFDHLVDCVICVTAPEEVRIQRVMARDGLTRERALDWLAKQFPQEEVRRRSDYEIVNDGLQDIGPQIDTIIQQINNKTKMQQTILSIAGKPGLYKLVSRGKMNLIVEALDETHKRMPAFATDRVTSLADIAMYTDAEDVPLMTILASLRDKEEGKEVSFNIKKASAKSCATISLRCFPISTATVFTIVISRNCSPGTTSS